MTTKEKSPQELLDEAKKIASNTSKEYIVDVDKLEQLDSTDKIIDLLKVFLRGVNIRIPSSLEGVEQIKYLLKEVK